MIKTKIPTITISSCISHITAQVTFQQTCANFSIRAGIGCALVNRLKDQIQADIETLLTFSSNLQYCFIYTYMRVGSLGNYSFRVYESTCLFHRIVRCSHRHTHTCSYQVSWRKWRERCIHACCQMHTHPFLQYVNTMSSFIYDIIEFAYFFFKDISQNTHGYVLRKLP